MQKVIKGIIQTSRKSGIGMWRELYSSNNDSIFPFQIKSLLLFGSFAFILFGVKAWIISYNGNATPFWDQWDAEANNLYRPYVNHTLTWHQMFDAHNEHRIFTTRLLALLLLRINHTWNPLLQMIVNAGLHVIAILLIVYLLARVIGQNGLVSLLAFSLVLFSIPYGWENTLAGFQSQFYFVLLFSFTALWMLLTREPLGIGWWFGLLSAVLAYLSLASGVFVLASTALVSIIVFFTNLRRTPRQLLATIVLITVFIAGVKLTPTIAGHAPLKASSFHQFYEASMIVFAWPVAHNFIAVIVCNLPILICILMILRKRPPANDSRWFLLGFIIWIFLQTIGIVAGRAAIALSSRYRDLFSILILANFGCLIYLLYNNFSKWKKWMIIGANVWIAIILISLVRYSWYHLPDEIVGKREISRIEATNTKNYLTSGDINYLKNKPYLYIPYPDAERLANILEQPGIREILPADIKAPLKPFSVETKPVDAFVGNGYYFTTPPRLDTTWGSYVPGQGDGAVGEMTLHFKNEGGSKRIAIPIAGYPLNDGMSIEIKQNGLVKHVSIENNPKETWGTAYGKIDSGDFSIILKDSSRSTWIAIAGPIVKGKLDNLTDRILLRYPFFILLGILGLLFLIVQSGLSKKSH